MVLSLALALLAVAHMDATPRSWILYYDSDSVLPALVRASILAGERQDWVLSAVLFIPEMGLYLGIAALGAGVKGTFALNAVVNLLLLYASLRFLSGMTQPGESRTARVGGGLAAFAATVFLMQLEYSPRGDSFELASLMATTTYYSMTVLASVLAIGAVARLVQHPGRQWRLKALLVAVSLLSTLTNPLYFAWAVVPLMLVLIMLTWRRVISGRLLMQVGVLLLPGSGAGFAARILFAPLVGKDGPAYAQPGLAKWSAVYYPQLVADRTSTVAGALALTLTVSLVLVSVIVFRKSLSTQDPAAAIVSGVAWVAPVAILIGIICVGAFGARYLQPLFFAPACTLVFTPRLFSLNTAAIDDRAYAAVKRLLACLVATGLAVAGVSADLLIKSAVAVDPDIQCVNDWITAANRTGAGSFWTIRGPKAYLAEPNRLVQVDNTFRAYPWLTDRADYSRTMVSYVVSDAAHPSPILPPAVGLLPSSTINCGRYTITDFEADVLPIGPAPAR
ncbi:hypothetical protein [Arthrobacter sp. MAHUQ-56]